MAIWYVVAALSAILAVVIGWTAAVHIELNNLKAVVQALLPSKKNGHA